MTEVSISLSRKDMKELFRHVYYGNWLLTATKDNPDKEIESFYQRFLSIMKNYNIINDIEYSDEHGSYSVNHEKEKELHEAIEDYNEVTFVEELIERLTQRDIESKYGEKQIEEMGENEFMRVFSKEETKYYDELNKSGILNIGIVK